MKHLIQSIIIALLVVGLTSCKSKAPEETGPPAEKQQTQPDEQAPVTDTSVQKAAVTEKIVEVGKIETDHGTILLSFFDDKAPAHVKKFKELARQGFYNGLTFHRILPGVLIEGGDPVVSDVTDTAAVPDRFIVPAEQSGRSHIRGAVSMDRLPGSDNSTAARFFIMLKTVPDFNENYTVFGEVTSGMDVADKIAAVPTGPRNAPTEEVVIKKVSIIQIKLSSL